MKVAIKSALLAWLISLSGNSLVKPWALILAFSPYSHLAYSDIEGHLSLTSNDIYRDISLSDNGPALQGLFTYTFL